MTENEILNASYDFTESEGFRHGARWALDQVSADSEINADLLAALEGLLEHVEWRRRIAKELTGPQDVTHRARAAIAKARGLS